MKKLFSLVLLTVFLFDCSAEVSVRGVKKSKRQFTTKIYRSKTKFNHRLKPTEFGFIVDTATKKQPKTIEDSVARKSKATPLEVEESNYSPSDAVSIDRSDFDPSYKKGDYTGYYKIGNPYQVFGTSYVPQEYESYEENGISSWYGDEFHGKKTANGEIYNMRDMTAAHRTLPLPSLVRVTNLRNGKNTVVRVSDRGPFAKNRIIDVSQRAADILGFKNQGTTEVKVELLREETDAMLRRLNLK